MVNFLLLGVVKIKTWGRALFGGMSKNQQIQFFDSQMYFPVILTPWIWNIFFKHGRIYKLEKKINKYSGEINTLGVHRNMRLYSWSKFWRTRVVTDRMFANIWPKGWDILWKRWSSRKWGCWLWNRGYRHLCTLVLKVEEYFMQSLSVLWLFCGDKKKHLKALLTRLFILPLLNSESRKKYTLRPLLTCLEALEEGFSYSLGETGRGLVGTYCL